MGMHNEADRDVFVENLGGIDESFEVISRLFTSIGKRLDNIESRLAALEAKPQAAPAPKRSSPVWIVECASDSFLVRLREGSGPTFDFPSRHEALIRANELNRCEFQP